MNDPMDEVRQVARGEVLSILSLLNRYVAAQEQKARALLTLVGMCRVDEDARLDALETKTGVHAAMLQNLQGSIDRLRRREGLFGGRRGSR